MIRKLVFLVAGLGLVAIAGFSTWFFFLREEGPDEVSTEAALQTLARTQTVAATTSASTGGATTPASGGTPSSATTPAGASPAASTDGIEGTWEVDTSLESFVGYRVQEELVSIGGVEAVGRTSNVTGSVVIEANTARSGSIVADMTTLRSQESARDGQLRNQGIEYGRFPTSEFTLTSPVELPDNLESGETVSLTLNGTLTLHGVTKDVEVPVEVTLQGDTLVVVGQIDILFADYDIAKPVSQRVVGIEDNGVMELQLFFRKS